MKKTLISWSSGKDSAWALHVLQQDPTVKIIGLFSTVNIKFNRVAMHGVRVELLQQQAQSVDVPLQIIKIPYPCSEVEYNIIMKGFIDESKAKGVECIAFGDLYLKHIRKYREQQLEGTGITPVFPIWHRSTQQLSREMINCGLKAKLACIDPKQIDKRFAGSEFNEAFLNNLPQHVDPCGENGEFHTFVFDGPMFQYPLEISVGKTIEREGFYFTDLHQTTETD